MSAEAEPTNVHADVEDALVLLYNGGQELTPEEEKERDQLAQELPDDKLSLIGILKLTATVAQLIATGKAPSEQTIADLWDVADLAFRSLKLGQVTTKRRKSK